MNPKLLPSAQWSYHKGRAQLINNQSVLLTIVFGKVPEIHFDNRKLLVKRTGFWRPTINITDYGTVLLTQTPTGIFGYSSDVRIAGRMYSGKSSACMSYKVSFQNSQGIDMVSYQMNAWKWKPIPKFTINEMAAPVEDVLLLLILGYFNLRKLKQDTEASVAVG